MEEIGYDRNVVILTQPLTYVKKKIKYGLLAKAVYNRYPKLTEAMLNRHERYNECYSYIRNKEQKGELLVVRPPEALNIGVSNKPDELQRVYDIGRREGMANLNRVKAFLDA